MGFQIVLSKMFIELNGFWMILGWFLDNFWLKLVMPFRALVMFDKIVANMCGFCKAKNTYLNVARKKKRVEDILSFGNLSGVGTSLIKFTMKYPWSIRPRSPQQTLFQPRGTLIVAIACVRFAVGEQRTNKHKAHSNLNICWVACVLV